MSYAFTMRFAQVKDKAEAFDLCCKVTDSLCSVSEAERYAISRYQYARWSIFGDKKPEREFLNLWVKNLLIIRFVFWPEENILALVGDYPDTIASDFGSAIYFQNGTDQDYEFEVWGNNIRLFNSLKKVAQRLSEKAVEDELGTEPASSEYGRRAVMYSMVFKNLELEEWLYGGSGNFVRFSMSGLTSQELTTAICLRVRVAVDRLEADGTFL